MTSGRAVLSGRTKARTEDNFKKLAGNAITLEIIWLEEARKGVVKMLQSVHRHETTCALIVENLYTFSVSLDGFLRRKTNFCTSKPWASMAIKRKLTGFTFNNDVVFIKISFFLSHRRLN
jgi:hypothetical protein